MRKYANYAIWMAGAVALILAATVTAGDYVGSETCSMCHTDKYDSWSETAHAESIKVLEEKLFRNELEDVYFTATQTYIGAWKSEGTTIIPQYEKIDPTSVDYFSKLKLALQNA
ncbi:MAG: hypothetical protein JSW52_06075, partial [Candidatus Coatesbacteria bacterium]